MAAVKRSQRLFWEEQLVGVVEVVRVALVLVVGKLYMWSQESYFHSDGTYQSPHHLGHRRG
jgi:hypothetical protein